MFIATHVRSVSREQVQKRWVRFLVGAKFTLGHPAPADCFSRQDEHYY
jgi:hypothetical protein